MTNVIRAHAVTRAFPPKLALPWLLIHLKQPFNSFVVPASLIGLSLLTLLPRVVCPQAIAQEVSPLHLAQASTANTTILFVDPQRGRDRPEGGTEAAPLKTITQALKQAQPNTVISLAPGTYSAQTGEVFPLRLKPQVTLQGNPGSRGQGVLIHGGGRFVSPTSAGQDITLLGANQAQLIGVTVTNPNHRGYGLWVESSNPVVTDNTFTANVHDGISVVGNSAPLIRGNYFHRNGANGITIYGTSRPEVRENIFENTGFGVNVNEKAAPLLVGNRITQNKDGVVVQAQAQPILRNNLIINNARDGIVAIAQAKPDLGNAQQPGDNTIQGNGRFNIHNASRQPLDTNVDHQRQSQPIAQVAINPSANRGSLFQLPGNALPPTSSGSSVNQPANFISEIPVEMVPPTSPPPIAPVMVEQRSLASSQASLPPVPTQPATTPALLSNATAIEIPVIVAPTGGTPSVSSSTQSRVTPAPKLAASLLPVPKMRIPVGNGGSAPKIMMIQGLPGGPPPPPLRGALLGFRYRVVVAVDDETQKSRVRALVPDAFRSFYNGRPVMQVGAFKEQLEVDAMVQLMSSNGFTPMTEQLQ